MRGRSACRARLRSADRLVSVTGNGRTRRENLLELLPRKPPAKFTEAELVEFERRVGNLAIFDQVKVDRNGSTLNVELREKWTLIPTVEFSGSQTFADAYALVGVTEYNAFGTGNQLALQVFREQRGWGTVIAYAEHPYRRLRWAFDVAGSASTARFRFEDGSSWLSKQFGLGGVHAGVSDERWHMPGSSCE